MQEKHQFQRVLAFVFTECMNFTDSLLAFFVDQDHFHIRCLIVTVIPGVYLFHDRPGLGIIRKGVLRQKANYCSEYENKCSKRSFHDDLRFFV
ncbi:hypothetical protein ES703_73297 [subsurface metagenome]